MDQNVHNKLKDFLEAYGWVYRFDGHNIFYSGWRSSNRAYSLRVQLNESILFFEVKLLSFSDLVQEKYSKSILEFLLRLNRKISAIKLGIDDEENIVLLTEVFSEQLTYEHLSKLLGIIGYYSEKIQEEILSHIHMLHNENHETQRYLI